MVRTKAIVWICDVCDKETETEGEFTDVRVVGEEGPRVLHFCSPGCAKVIIQAFDNHTTYTGASNALDQIDSTVEKNAKNA